MTVGQVSISNLKLPGNPKRVPGMTGDFSIILSTLLQQLDRVEFTSRLDLTRNETSLGGSAAQEKETVAVTRTRTLSEPVPSERLTGETLQDTGPDKPVSGANPGEAKNAQRDSNPCDCVTGRQETGTNNGKSGKVSGEQNGANGANDTDNKQANNTGKVGHQASGTQEQVLKGEGTSVTNKFAPAAIFMGKQLLGENQRIVAANEAAGLTLAELTSEADSFNPGEELQPKGSGDVARGLRPGGNVATDAVKLVTGEDGSPHLGDRVNGKYGQIKGDRNGFSMEARSGAGSSAGQQVTVSVAGKTITGPEGVWVANMTVNQGQREGGAVAGAARVAAAGSLEGSQMTFTALNGLNRPGSGPGSPLSNMPAVLASVLETARLARLGSQRELEIQLRPECLGNLKIRALMTGSDLTLHLLVESNEAARALQSMAAEMRQVVAQQGLRLDQVQVQVQAGSGGFGGEEQSEGQHGYHQGNGWQRQAAGWQGETAAQPEASNWYRLDYLA